MNEIAKIIGNFFYRDLVYITSGFTLIFSIIFCLDQINLLTSLPQITTVFVLVISYSIGFSVQELFGMLKLCRTRANFKPRPITVFFYKLIYNKIPFNGDNVNGGEIHGLKHELQKKAAERNLQEYYRIINLKHIGITLGPTYFLSGNIVLLFTLLSNEIVDYKMVMSGSLIFFGCLLLIIGNIKSVQQAEFLYDFSKNKENY